MSLKYCCLVRQKANVFMEDCTSDSDLGPQIYCSPVLPRPGRLGDHDGGSSRCLRRCRVPAAGCGSCRLFRSLSRFGFSRPVCLYSRPSSHQLPHPSGEVCETSPLVVSLVFSSRVLAVWWWWWWDKRLSIVTAGISSSQGPQLQYCTSQCSSRE